MNRISERKVCGIYSITNTINGKRYYGSSLNAWGRKRQHWSDLGKSKHKNPHLQAAWNKYGKAAFEFTIVEEVAAENLQAVEQTYLDHNHNGYNISKCAECAPRGLKWSEESKKRRSEAMRGRKLSTEHRKALSLAGMGRRATSSQRAAMSRRMKGSIFSSKTREKMSLASKKHWECPKYRKQMIKAQSVGKGTAAAKRNYSAAMTARWANVEQKRVLSEERKARWANPEYRAKMVVKRRIQGKQLRIQNQIKEKMKHACT